MPIKSTNLVCALCLVLTGCPSRSTTPDAARRVQKTDSFSMIKVMADTALVYSFFDSRAQLRHVDLISQVESTARADVMVTDERRKLQGDLVFVADLRKKRKDDTFRVWVESRSSWFDRMMPQKSMLDAPPQVVARKTKKKRKRRPRSVRRPRPASPGPVAARAGPARGQPGAGQAKGQPNVILFSTQWCPACRKARAYFTQKRIPFREMDVQKDPRAAQLYMEVVKRFKLKAGLVPVIIVNGRVFGGFSPQHIEAALAAGPPKK